jgi:hypothetical protein
MNQPAAEPAAAESATFKPDGAGNRYRRRARFELIFASIWLVVGLLVLPAIIFAVGGALLGPYGDSPRLGRFYGDFFGDLAEPSVRAWALALGPLALISILRLVFAGAGREPQEPQEPPDRPAAPRRTEEARRVEPSVGND